MRRHVRSLLPLTCGALLLLLFAPGCAFLKALSKDSEKPSAKVTGTRIDALTLDSATLVFDVEVTNPYEVDLPIVDLDYRLESSGTEFVAGQAPVAGSIPARGSKVISLPATVEFPKLLAVLRDVKPGAVIPYAASLDLSVDAPVVGSIALPLKKEGDLPIPTVPEVELQSVQWEELSLTEAKAVIDLRVTNTNEFALALSKLDYDLSLADTKVAHGGIPKSEDFGAGAEKNLRFAISFAPQSLGFAAYRMLTGSGASYELGGSMTGETPFGPLELPFKKKGETVFER